MDDFESKSLCYCCKQIVFSGREKKGFIEIRQCNKDDEDHIVNAYLIFHAECFEEVAGKQYMPSLREKAYISPNASSKPKNLSIKI